jgi:tRNA (cytidine/uridine-2'-O-)-methyltransferase
MSKHAREASKQDANKAQPFSGDLGSTTCHPVSKRHTTVADRIVDVDVYVNVDGLSLFPDTLLALYRRLSVGQTEGVLHVILFQPEIPQNTGNVGRMCDVTGSRLHLIHPLGFEINDRNLRRAGMDYWRRLDVIEHRSWQEFLADERRPARIWLFTTRASRTLWQVRLADGDGLLFGREAAGCPDWLHQWAGERRVRIPQPNPEARSLNLATAAGIATYEGLRQCLTGECA